MLSMLLGCTESAIPRAAATADDVAIREGPTGHPRNVMARVEKASKIKRNIERDLGTELAKD
jgi:hypothetical protein